MNSTANPTPNLVPRRRAPWRHALLLPVLALTAGLTSGQALHGPELVPVPLDWDGIDALLAGDSSAPSTASTALELEVAGVPSTPFALLAGPRLVPLAQGWLSPLGRATVRIENLDAVRPLLRELPLFLAREAAPPGAAKVGEDSLPGSSPGERLVPAPFPTLAELRPHGLGGFIYLGYTWPQYGLPRTVYVDTQGHAHFWYPKGTYEIDGMVTVVFSPLGQGGSSGSGGGEGEQLQ